MYTAIYKKVRSGYVAWVEEIPGVNTQGVSKKETRDNLSDALSEFLLARRALTNRELSRGGSYEARGFYSIPTSERVPVRAGRRKTLGISEPIE
ncbi:MAG: type II toxin-antitoxin system HicB family antitoxin [Minisyncoccota bacterium]